MNPLRIALAVLTAALVSLVFVVPPASAANLISSLNVGYQADASETPATQAGSHPFSQTTEINFVNVPDPELGFENTETDAKDIEVRLPTGFVGDPTAG